MSLKGTQGGTLIPLSAGTGVPVRLTEGQKAALKQLFPDRPEKACEDCGGYHLRACRRIKRQAWLGNGNRTEVEYWPDGSWDESEVIYPEDVFSEEDE